MSEIKIPTDEEIAEVCRVAKLDHNDFSSGMRGIVLWGLKGYAMAAKAEHILEQETNYFHRCPHCAATHNSQYWLREVARQKGIEI